MIAFNNKTGPGLTVWYNTKCPVCDAGSVAILAVANAAQAVRG